LRFRPFDQSLALLFGELVKELDGHRSELLFHASRHLDWTVRLNKTASRCETENAGYFFIVAEEQAIAVLGEALALMREATRFYRFNAVLAPRGSMLGGIYQNFGALKEPHVEMLREQLEEFQLRQLRPVRFAIQEPVSMGLN
jgi:hypothetical protein